MPGGSITKTAGNVTVTASWGEGVFEEGVTMSLTAKPLDPAAVNLGDEYRAVDGEAVDITFRNKAGEHVQPADGKHVSIKMTLSAARALQGSKFFVLHEEASTAPQTRNTKGMRTVKSSGGSAKLKPISGSVSATGASFSAGSFSIYAVVGAEAENRVQVSF